VKPTPGLSRILRVLLVTVVTMLLLLAYQAAAHAAPPVGSADPSTAPWQVEPIVSAVSMPPHDTIVSERMLIGVAGAWNDGHPPRSQRY
jgi:hypothetical protein